MRLKIKPIEKKAIPLGKVGENIVTELAFDIGDWQREFGDGTCELLILRPHDDVAYVRQTVIDGVYAEYTLVDDDICQQGYGSMQLRYTVGEAVVKTYIYRTITANSLDGDTPEPPAWETWLEQFQELAAEAQGYANDAQGYANDSQGYANDASGYANDASGYADAAAASVQDIEDLTVSAVALPAGTAPTATKTHPTGSPVNIQFGIPGQTVWFGTQSEYNAIQVKDENTLYFILDLPDPITTGTYKMKATISTPALDALLPNEGDTITIPFAGEVLNEPPAGTTWNTDVTGFTFTKGVYDVMVMGVEVLIASEEQPSPVSGLWYAPDDANYEWGGANLLDTFRLDTVPTLTETQRTLFDLVFERQTV